MIGATGSAASRRRFLQLLAGSPLLASGGADEAVLADLKDALNVLEFEAAARKAIPPAHFGYLATGVDATVRANREALARIQLRPRRLIDVSKVDMSVELLGTKWETPILLAPVANQRAFHSEGEAGVARAAKQKRTLQVLSTFSSYSVEEVNREGGRPVWFQLYPTSSLAVAERVVKRAEAAGCPVLVLTTDIPAGRNPETQKRFERLDKRQCSSCHGPSMPASSFRRPIFEGLDVAGLVPYNATLTWDYVDRLRRMTRMKLVLKGIVTREDARLCREHGADAIVVSNHGGRAEETGRATIESLPEVLDGAGPALPVLIDGGFRRGADIFKALAFGARAVAIGRPYVWGLGAFGQAGVEKVIDLLQAELRLIMQQCGARSLAQIARQSVTGL
ncbi:MAG: alpha-hydroxy-acid oxidizing protein [Candidatus Solibacter usitatus]|nr:alpha-hydroxy-acid oxidizing protein [Candidatus Solibacter usitatus]